MDEFFSWIPTRNETNINQRAERGFSDSDVQDFDTYLAGVISLGLARLAEIADSYPDGYDTFEEWQNDLLRISENFKIIAMTFSDYCAYKEINEFAFQRGEFEKIKENIMNETFDWLKKYWSHLWN